ncbi:hypothetical protein KJ742_03540 [Patescibacteria group bacterium]|nr:hypothetical protein [Patescibacteria group bacterium]MBU1682994.1 hypothetical protein [Patescibacteria group bacterium]MBU1934767.1 hypothetical protein [Patescibacteria group bacterium]
MTPNSPSSRPSSAGRIEAGCVSITNLARVAILLALTTLVGCSHGAAAKLGSLQGASADNNASGETNSDAENDPNLEAFRQILHEQPGFIGIVLKRGSEVADEYGQMKAIGNVLKENGTLSPADRAFLIKMAQKYLQNASSVEEILNKGDLTQEDIDALIEQYIAILQNQINAISIFCEIRTHLSNMSGDEIDALFSLQEGEHGGWERGNADALVAFGGLKTAIETDVQSFQ